MVTLWVKPDNRDHQITVMFKTETHAEAFSWNLAAERTLKKFSGFQQIHMPSVCSWKCDDHWGGCPGTDGWELLFQHPSQEEFIKVVAELIDKATQLEKEWGE